MKTTASEPKPARKTPVRWSDVSTGAIVAGFHKDGILGARKAAPDRTRAEVIAKLDSMKLREIEDEAATEILDFAEFVKKSKYPDLVAREAIKQLREILDEQEALD